MRHAFGFLVPAAAEAAANSFAQQIALAAIAGVFGVIGVVLATYFGDELRWRRHQREFLRRLRPRGGDRERDLLHQENERLRRRHHKKGNGK